MNTNNPIVVFGGTGHYGQWIVKSLLKNNVPVRILTRNLDKATEIFGDQVELVFGDVQSKNCISQSLQNAGGVVICLSAFTPKLIRQLWPIEHDAVLMILDEMIRMKIERLVYLSVYDIRLDLLNQLKIRKLAEVKIAVEKYIKNSPFNWTILGCPPSYELFFELLRDNRMIVPGGGKKKIACISCQDVGEIAAQAVLRNDLSGRRFRMAGPEAVSFPDVIKKISAYSGKKIKHFTPPLLFLNLLSLLAKPFNPFLRFIYFSLKLMNNFPEDLTEKVTEDHNLLVKEFEYQPTYLEQEIEKRFK